MMKLFCFYLCLILLILFCIPILAQEGGIQKTFGPEFAEVGKEMPDAILFDTIRHEHRLADYLGKYILLNFWDVYCSACKKALPELREIIEKQGDKLTVISINSNFEYITNWQGAINKYGFSWVNLTDMKKEGGIASRYKVVGVPRFVLISPEGIILKIWDGYGENSLKFYLSDYFEEFKVKRKLSY